MNILFINLPYSGHILPTLGLVTELQKNKNHVTYLLTEEWRGRITDIGAEFESYPSDKKLSEQMKNACAAAEKLIPDYDLVLYEQFFFLGKHLAEKYGKPVVRIFTSVASNEQIMKNFVNAGGGGLGVFRSKWICKNWTRDIAKDIPLKTDCWLSEIIENPPALNLVYTLRDFQPYAGDFPDNQFKFIGASIYARKAETAFSMPQSSQPIIYISLGTIVNKATSFYKKCMKAFAHENVTVIMSIGDAVKEKDLGVIPANFHVYPFVPQLEVLKAADVFLTHGGLNSVTEALYYGVPMVVIPFMTDQPTNAAQVENLGLGIKLERKKLTSGLLRETTLSLLNNKTIHQNCSDMKQKMQAVNANQYGADLIVQYQKTFSHNT